MMDHTTGAVAVSAMASPVWLPWLQTASEVAATVAPILGGLWLLTQIGVKIYETYRKYSDKDH